MRRTSGMLLLLTGLAVADVPEEIGRQLERVAAGAGQSGPVLSKSGALTATSYTSTYFNMTFTCPSGWTISNFDSTASTVTFKVNKTGRQSVTVFGSRMTTATEARLMDSHAIASAIKAVYPASQASPSVASFADTSASGVHVGYVNLDYDASGSSRVYDMITASTGIYSQFVAYSVTLSDYNSNYADYDAISDNIDFVTTVGVAKAMSKQAPGVTQQGNTVFNPGGFKIDFLNAQGRKEMVSSERKITLDPSRKLFLKVHGK